MMKIKQIIVVEGKTDTAKIRKALGYEVETIETNGFALNIDTLNLIKKINQANGVIVFTDPDGPGVKIREKINTYLDFKCLNAFINKKDIKNSKKIGIAEAEEKDIIKALENLIEFNGEASNTLSWSDYLKSDFYLKENRIKIANNFNWSENINTKTLYRYLNLSSITMEEIKNILEKG